MNIDEKNKLILTDLESEVLKLFLRGESSNFKILREQLSRAKIKSREFSGAGFFTNFEVPEEIEKIKKDIKFPYISARVPSRSLPLGFVLFLKDGKLDMLEGYTYESTWPEEINDFEVYIDESIKEI